jgi:predicted O-methyltransferase YrrM
MKEKKRWDVLIHLLKERPHAIGAEVGVWKGFTTIKLLQGLPGIKKYYAIDPWKLYEDFEKSLTSSKMLRQAKDMDKVIEIYKQKISPFKDKVITMRKTSKGASLKIEDNSLDFVFIDGNHDYKYVREDIGLWLPKVKPGGLISGHDYERDDGTSLGVKKAVHEFFDKVQTGANYVWWAIK